MPTTTQQNTVRRELNAGNANTVADILKRIKAGDMFAVLKVTFAGLTSAAAQDITTAASRAAATIVGGDFNSDELLPAIGGVTTLRVTAGAAAAGHRAVTDAGGTASTSLALLSDDGKSLTFEAAVTGFVLTYRPRPAVAMSASYP